MHLENDRFLYLFNAIQYYILYYYKKNRVYIYYSNIYYYILPYVTYLKLAC